MSKYREEVMNILEELEGKAMKLDYWRTTIFFISPVTGELESRTIFAEHQVDAQQWAYDMYEKYHKMKIPYYVFSTAYDSNFNGGLFQID